MLKRSPASVPGHRTLTFILPAEWADRVSVVGNFNDWTPRRLTLARVGDRAEASVDLPNEYIAVFRYLGEGDHWFDEPEADFVDGGASVVLAAPAVEPVEARVAEPVEALPSPAQKAKKVSRKRREREEEKVQQAAEKKRRKRKELADKITKAAQKQRKAAERMARERERMARKAAKKAAKKA